MRWLLRLMEFDYEILYHPDHFQEVPDALSRLPQPAMENYAEVEY